MADITAPRTPSSAALFALAVLFGWSGFGCVPNSDLGRLSSGSKDTENSAGAGGRENEGIGSGGSAGLPASSSPSHADSGSPHGTGGEGGAGGFGSTAGATSADSGSPTGATGGSDGGGSPGVKCTSAGYDSALAEPPLFSPESPVSGEVFLSENSSWEVADGVLEQAYEIRTPTAVYFLHLASGALVSMTNVDASTQWIQYSYGGQPDRGLPLLGGCCAPPANGDPPAVMMNTEKDEEKSSLTHLRVNSVSQDEQWKLAWDFYLTHVTVTVEDAGADYGFAYKGTPGGPDAELGVDLWLNGEPMQNAAAYAMQEDLPFPEWARFAEKASDGESLFLIQHRDDCLADAYRARNLPSEKTAVFTFGDGKIPAARPTRVSFGLVSNDAAQERVDYVVKTME